MMQFESLANELLLDIFEYFNADHLLCAFYGLNSRFDTLLYKHFRSYYLDLRRISKKDFGTICQQHLPSIVDRVVSLCLSDYDETPGLPELFLSRGFTLDQFIHLRSLSLDKISSKDTIKILCKINRLIHLIHLNISRCYTPYEQRDAPYMINQIWSLPKLTHFSLETYCPPDIDFTRLTVISSTLEHLSIQTANARSFSDMSHLFRYSPRLRTLSVWIRSENDDEKLETVVTSIITLNLEFSGSPRALRNLFQDMPNLCHLTIDMRNCYMNGHEWKAILVDHLPKIKVFRLKMNITLFRDDITEKRVDELLDTFRTPFWLDEHQWFVRCDWDPHHGPSPNSLYTSPYAFDVFTGVGNGQSKWTGSDDRKYWSFDRVHRIRFRTSTNEHLDLGPARFPNIHQLVISLPWHDKIWCIIPTFDHLTSLHMSMYGKDSESELQILFDRAPCLYSLSIDNPCPLDLMMLFRLSSASIRRLQFLPERDFASYYLNDAECAALARSPLGRQCEVLYIRVESQTNIVDLVNTMGNLRAMTAFCKYDQIEKSLSTENELIQWLQNHLPTRCVISRYTSYRDDACITLWIG